MFFHPNKKKMSFNLTQKDYIYIIFYRLKTKFEFRKIILAKLFFIHGKRKNHLSSHKNRSENVIICMKLKLCLCVCVFSYMQTGCTSLKLIMKHFWLLISETLKASPSVGVDITREER